MVFDFVFAVGSGRGVVFDVVFAGGSGGGVVFAGVAVGSGGVAVGSGAVAVGSGGVAVLLHSATFSFTLSSSTFYTNSFRNSHIIYYIYIIIS